MNASPDLAEQLMNLSFRLARQMRKRMTSAAKDVNLVQVHAMAMVDEHEGITMKELAAQLKITSPSATSFVQRLVAAGCVERFTDPRNRKQIHLRLTAAGRKLLAAKKEERMLIMRGLISQIEEKDRAELIRIFTRLVEAAER